MTIIEYTPHSFGARIQHKREIRRMTDRVMPRTTTPALLAVFVAVFVPLRRLFRKLFNGRK